MNDFGESRELFQLRSGRVILDEDMKNLLANTICSFFSLTFIYI